MEVIHTFQVNLAAPGNAPVLHAVQYDGSRKIAVQLYSGTAVWAVPEGVTVGIGYILPNRQGGYYEALNDGTAACETVGNTVTAVLAPVVTSVVGETRVSLIFTRDGKQISTFPFRLRVSERPGQVNPGAQPDAASPFAGKLYYGGDMGTAIPLELGSGVRVEQTADGRLRLVAVGGGGSGGGIAEETDPTVPAWAKQAQKPRYTAQEVGADPMGTAQGVLTGHESNLSAHPYLHQEINALRNRLNALADSDDTTLDQLSEIVAYIKSNKSLIDAITTSKVSVSDIVDDLTTYLSDRPLSAAMGAELRDVQRELESKKLDASKLTEAINTALAQAKASGAFDGAAGAQGDRGETGAEGPQGPKGDTPVKGVDYYTEDDKAEMVAMVLEALGGNVISGYVDEENNIVIMGLPEGDYTVKYEMEDGSTIDIGALEVGEAEPEEHNYFDASTALLNHRLGSSGSPSSYNGMVATDYIPWNEEMSGKNFVVSGVARVASGAYSYYSRTVYYDENKSKVTEYNDTGDLDAYIPSVLGAYTGGGFVRISLVLKDNVALNAADVANLKITLE